MKKVLVILAHPSINSSEINSELFNAAHTLGHVTTVDLYREYPDFCIDVEREQQRLASHDAIVFLFPIYWYSTPPLLKQWQDTVLTYGFAYGSQGSKLQGKHLLCVTSTGSNEESYRDKETSEVSLRSVLLPIERTAQDTGMRFIEPLTLYGARTAVEEERLTPHTARFVDALNMFALCS